MRHSFPSRRLDSRELDSRRTESRRQAFTWLESLWKRVRAGIGLADTRQVRTTQSRRRARSWFGTFAGEIRAAERPAERTALFELVEPRLVFVAHPKMLTPSWLEMPGAMPSS